MPLPLRTVPVLGYNVFIEKSSLPSIASRIQALLSSRCSLFVILYDKSLMSLHLPTLISSFDEVDIPYVLIDVPSGELCKQRAIKASIEDEMLRHKADRDACLVSFGGGTVSDLGGFVAATYLRGIRCVHIPTTLLGMVDASVGGKTAIDVPAGKNLIGAYKQPEAVFIDVEVLQTLPICHMRNGYVQCLIPICAPSI